MTSMRGAARVGLALTLLVGSAYAQPAPAPAPPPAAAPPVDERRRGPAIAGSIGTPGNASPPTGDSQLDRVQSINIDQLRDQRSGAASSGIPERGPSVATAGPSAAPPPPGGPVGGPSGAPNSFNSSGQPLPEEPKKETPVYKKWWFWAVVGVSGYVVYQLATASSSPSRTSRELLSTDRARPGGLTLMSW